MQRIFLSSFGHRYFINDSRKHGTSLFEEPSRRMVMNLPFLLLPWLARSFRIRSDTRRSMQLPSSEINHCIIQWQWFLITEFYVHGYNQHPSSHHLFMVPHLVVVFYSCAVVAWVKASALFSFFSFYYYFLYFLLVSHLCMQIYASPPIVIIIQRRNYKEKHFFLKFLAGIELATSGSAGQCLIQ